MTHCSEVKPILREMKRDIEFLDEMVADIRAVQRPETKLYADENVAKITRIRERIRMAMVEIINCSWCDCPAESDIGKVQTDMERLWN